MSSKIGRRTEFRVTEALRILPLNFNTKAGSSIATGGMRPPTSLDAFCFESTQNLNVTSSIVGQGNFTSLNAEIVRLKFTFRIIMVSISVIGVAGNVLNLLTLRSPSLRTVPFRYIRALAVYDLVSLTTILVHFLLETWRFEYAPIIYYKVWVEDVIINSFLVAGLYVAVLLTIERYLLIRKPHKSSRLLSIENSTNLKIALALIASVILHLPMTLQNTVKRDIGTGRLIKGNNQRLLCREPYWTIFNYYKMFREFLRFFCVVLLISLNIIIAKSLQVAKKNRRMLIKRSSQPDSCSGADIVPVSCANATHHHNNYQQQLKQSQQYNSGKGNSNNNNSTSKNDINNSNGIYTKKQRKTRCGSADTVDPKMMTPRKKFMIGRKRISSSVMSSVKSRWIQRWKLHGDIVKSTARTTSSKGSIQNLLSKVPDCGNVPAIKEKSNKRDLSLLKSFTEKKLTVLMGAICLIYVIGNVPQMVVMVVQNEAFNDMFRFQVFRNVANTLEVLNHCLNFFIFCMASSEYTRAFLLNNCAIIRRCLLSIPCIERFINTGRANSIFSLFDHYDLQPTISEVGLNYKTDSTAAMRKHSMTTMSTFNLSITAQAQNTSTSQDGQLNAFGEIIRRKSVSMCLPTSLLFDAAVIEVCSTPPASSLGESPRFLSPLQPRHYCGLLNQKHQTFSSRGSVCVSLLSGDKMSLSSLCGGQPAMLTYRDNKFPQRRESMRPNSGSTIPLQANRSPSLHDSIITSNTSKSNSIAKLVIGKKSKKSNEQADIDEPNYEDTGKNFINSLTKKTFDTIDIINDTIHIDSYNSNGEHENQADRFSTSSSLIFQFNVKKSSQIHDSDEFL